MAINSTLICNFSLSSPLDLNVSFVSNDGGASYGGQITIFTPVTAGPVTTGLWDNDGNVFFTLYLTEAPETNCVVNSGSRPGSWDPYITIARESGLTCQISEPQQVSENEYNYTLTVTQTEA